MKEHTVSVVIPAYRAAGTIARALDSLMVQSRRPDEILVIDDGSPDDLPAALKRYEGQVKYIRQENAGAAAARNRGIEEATGSLVAFLDADDYWEPLRLQRQIEVLDKFPQVGLVAAVYFTQPPNGVRTPQHIFRPQWLDNPVRAAGADIIELGSLIWTGTILIRRPALGEHRFTSGLEPAEDRDMWIRILRSHSAYVISTPLATAVLEPNSLSRGDPDFSYGSMIRVLHRHADLVKPAERRRLQAVVYRGWGAEHLAGGFGRSALGPALKRLVRQPLSAEAWWVVAKSTALSIIHPQRKAKRRLIYNGRGESALRRHYQVERELANRLRIASAAQRQQLYGQVYNELFQKVPDHPQNIRKADPTGQEEAAQWQLKLLSHFLTPGAVYLEVGAGDCSLTMKVAAKARQAIAVDVSDVIAQGKADHPSNFALYITDGLRLPIPPGTVNIAYSHQVMEHLHPDDAEVQLAEIRRSLAPGGSYICITPHHHSGPWDISRFFASEAHGFHLKEYTYRELQQLMLRAGFISTSVWTGLKGHFFRVPQSVVLGVEALLGMLPRDLQKSLTRSALMRPVFTNVMIVGHVAEKPKSKASPMPPVCEVAQ